MPVFRLNSSLQFPHPSYAEEDGLLAVGGDLSPDRLLLAYENGIFPWFNDDEEILWWSPDPRCVLFPKKLKVSKSMRGLINKQVFKVTFDQSFTKVIEACSSEPRKGQDGTWITTKMKNAYQKLHELGWAHSVEVWKEGQLVGGLYGLLIGKVFFGESMFSKESNASKYGFITWVRFLEEKGIELIDCQQTTKHLLSLGAEEIPRERFLELLEKHI